MSQDPVKRLLLVEDDPELFEIGKPEPSPVQRGATRWA